MSTPTRHTDRIRRRMREEGESGQVSIGVLLTALVVIGATFAFMVFAEAVDLRAGTQKGADSAATAAAASARSTWIEAWLRAQQSSPIGDPSDDLYDDGETGLDDPHEDDSRDVEFDYRPPDDLMWQFAAQTARPAALEYAARNDGGALTGYQPQGGNRIAVDVHRAKDTASPQGDRFVPRVVGTSSSTAKVVTPPGLVCAPLPNGLWSAWTLQCTSMRGQAQAQYIGAMLVAWDERAFERMYTIRIDD